MSDCGTDDPGIESHPGLLLRSAVEQLRLEGAILFRSELTEAFAFESTPQALAPVLHPQAERLILFHIVTGGGWPSSRPVPPSRARCSASASARCWAGHPFPTSPSAHAPR